MIIKSSWDPQSWWLPLTEVVHTLTASSLTPPCFLSEEGLEHARCSAQVSQCPLYTKHALWFALLCPSLKLSKFSVVCFLLCFINLSVHLNSKYTAALRKTSTAVADNISCLVQLFYFLTFSYLIFYIRLAFYVC